MAIVVVNQKYLAVKVKLPCLLRLDIPKKSSYCMVEKSNHQVKQDKINNFLDEKSYAMRVGMEDQALSPPNHQ